MSGLKKYKCEGCRKWVKPIACERKSPQGTHQCPKCGTSGVLRVLREAHPRIAILGKI